MVQALKRAEIIPRWLSKFLEALNTPTAVKVAILWRHGEWDQIANLSVDPHHYDDSLWGAEKFSRDVQAVDFLRKNRDLKTTFDREEVAVQSFYRSEQKCYRSNERLRVLNARYRDGFPVDSLGLRLHNFVDAVRRRVRKILGPLPTNLREQVKFGPGATYESKSFLCSDVTIGDKITENCAATPEALAVVRHSCEGTPIDIYANWVARLFPVRGNRFISVPKNAKTFRGICIEPGANVYVQLAVGRFVRLALRKVGIDLDHGQHHHQLLAGEGSVTGSWCTIDLESASDTVSYELVKLLLPEQWFLLLDSLRSPYTSVNGKWVKLEKFSSMGNGFTFELETLIFGVIAEVASNGQLGDSVFVYGDDIIVPNDRYHDVVAALKYFGFVPNDKKSFATSCFRESCGGQYFNGVKVQTCKLETLPREPLEWFSLHNGLYRFRRYLTTSARLAIRDEVPMPWKGFRGPTSLGDSVLWEEDKNRWVTKWHAGWQTDLVRSLQPSIREVNLWYFKPEVVHLLALYGIPSRGIMTRTIVGHRSRWVIPYGIGVEKLLLSERPTVKNMWETS